MAERRKNRAAQGAGSIRQRANGRWEARYTIGRDPGTGRQIQKTILGATQKEVLDKLTTIKADINNGTYTEPSKLTMAQWLDIWTGEYLNRVKPRTIDSYQCTCRTHLKPSLGAVKLQALSAHTIQTFYNKLSRERELSGKTIKNIHGVLHKALQQAVKLKYIHLNPANGCDLPRVEKREMVIVPDNSVSDFIKAVKGHPYETVYFVDLFTGMRQGEVLGITWDSVNFDKGTILINKQLQKERKKGGEYRLVPTKGDKARKITPAKAVMGRLQEQKDKQKDMQRRIGKEWNNPLGLVFTNEYGRNLAPTTVYKHLKRIVASIGIPEARFHDLRHSYAVASLQAGDDIKTLQENLGHHTAAFTLDFYGHVTEGMKKKSADNMDKFILAAQGE